MYCALGWPVVGLLKIGAEFISCIGVPAGVPESRTIYHILQIKCRWNKAYVGQGLTLENFSYLDNKLKCISYQWKFNQLSKLFLKVYIIFHAPNMEAESSLRKYLHAGR